MSDLFGKIFSVLKDTINCDLFIGVPNKHIIEFYRNMDSSVMHYIPTTDVTTAVGISNGIYMGGGKTTAVIVPSDVVSLIDMAFNYDRFIPITVITDNTCSIGKQWYKYNVHDVKSLKAAVRKITANIENNKIFNVMVLC